LLFELKQLLFHSAIVIIAAQELSFLALYVCINIHNIFFRMFLTEQFKLLQQRLEDAIPAAKKAFLQQYFSQVCNSSKVLRK
jgi:hypothetical protein